VMLRSILLGSGRGGGEQGEGSWTSTATTEYPWPAFKTLVRCGLRLFIHTSILIFCYKNDDMTMCPRSDKQMLVAFGESVVSVYCNKSNRSDEYLILVAELYYAPYGFFKARYLGFTMFVVGHCSYFICFLSTSSFMKYILLALVGNNR
jgi:hypothetical protein